MAPSFFIFSSHNGSPRTGFDKNFLWNGAKKFKSVKATPVPLNLQVAVLTGKPEHNMHGCTAELDHIITTQV